MTLHVQFVEGKEVQLVWSTAGNVEGESTVHAPGPEHDIPTGTVPHVQLTYLIEQIAQTQLSTLSYRDTF